MIILVRNDRLAHWIARHLPRNVLRWAVIHANAKFAWANPTELGDGSATARALVECLELPPRPSKADRNPV